MKENSLASLWVPPVRLGILLSLQAGPAYGYAIHRRLQKATGAEWTTQIGSIYVGFRSLKKEGLVESTPQPPVGVDPRRRYVQLTPSGRRLVARAIPVLRGLLQIADQDIA